MHQKYTHHEIENLRAAIQKPRPLGQSKNFTPGGGSDSFGQITGNGKAKILKSLGLFWGRFARCVAGKLNRKFTTRTTIMWSKRSPVLVLQAIWTGRELKLCSGALLEL